jgi:hypothetical protein
MKTLNCPLLTQIIEGHRFPTIHLADLMFFLIRSFFCLLPCLADWFWGLGGGDVSVVKSTSYSFRGPGFYSQHAHRSSQLSVTPVSEEPTPSHIHTDKTPMHINFPFPIVWHFLLTFFHHSISMRPVSLVPAMATDPRVRLAFPCGFSTVFCTYPAWKQVHPFTSDIS